MYSATDGPARFTIGNSQPAGWLFQIVDLALLKEWGKIRELAPQNNFREEYG